MKFQLEFKLTIISIADSKNPFELTKTYITPQIVVISLTFYFFMAYA